MSEWVNAYGLVFPVVGGEHIDSDDRAKGIHVKQVYGSAFHIGQHWFLTAGHVIQAALSHGFFGLGFPDGTSWKATEASDYEVISHYDIGLVRAPVPSTTDLKWSTRELSMLTDVITSGYPYALDLQHFIIRVRAFKGHIVSSLTYHRIPASPRSYELSFQAPRGLSGAPLMIPGRNPLVAGVIVENRSTKMRVLERIEVQKGACDEVVEEYEVLHLGIAIQASSLLNVESQHLGGTLLKHLQASGLHET